MINKLRLFAVIILVSLLAACGQQEAVEMATAVSPTTISPTPKPSATATTIPTETPTKIPTATATATATATTIPTLTPLPTFAPDELETAVADLLANPMNCDVPCWWGAIPGETTIDEIKHSIAPYNFEISEYDYEDDGEPINVLILGIGYDEARNSFDIKMGYAFSGSTLIDVSAYSPPISEILTKYGSPDEIWFSAMNDPRQKPPLVWFTIIYLHEGMGIGYVVDGRVQGDMLIGCIADESTERLRELRLITPGNAVSYKDFPGTFDEERFYLPLEEATDLTIEEFMQQFSDPTQPQCLETPTKLWD